MSDTHRSFDAEAVLRSLGGHRFATRVTAQDASVRDHLVHRTPVLPGVFHLDLVLRLVRHLGVDPSVVELRRCVFIRPLIAVGDLDRQLQVTVGEPDRRGAVPVAVRSRPLLGGEVADEEWQTNFQAEIHAVGPWEPAPVPAGRLDVASGPLSLDADDLYGLARQLDIEHGPFMKVQGRVGAGAGFSVADVHLDPSAVEQIGHFFVHPVFMDFSVLVPFLQFPEPVRRGIVQPFIPIYVDSFRARRSLEARTLVHAPRLASLHVDDSTQAVVADIDLCTPDGEVAVRLGGYRAKRVRTTEDIRKHAEEGQRLTAAKAARPGPTTPVAAPAPAPAAVPASAPAPAEASAPAPAPAGDLTALVTDLIAAHITERTGNPTPTVHPDQGFYDELGLTSVDLLNIAGQLETALNTQLYPTLLFEHPTISQLVTHLHEEGIQTPTTTTPTTPPAPTPAATAPAPASDLTALVTDLIAAHITERTGNPTPTVHPDQGFYDELGLTSVDLLNIAGQLETALNTQLYPTLLFEHPTISQLVTHLHEEGIQTPTTTTSTTPPAPTPAATAPAPVPTPTPAAAPAPADAQADAPMAIIGVAGRYPGARDLEEFWDVLRSGRDCLGEIPADRWNADDWYAPEAGVPGRTYLRRGGFIDGVDRFDSLFFNIPPQQAKLMDPHERQFLEVAWSALEDAGYTPESISTAARGPVGVFAGSMWADYHLHGLESVRGGGTDVALSWLGGIPNRVSHAFDFRGPSVLVDTACSSSLTALHQACESIRRGECRAALVGGASLSLHPYKYVRSAANGLLSKDGTSRPFGDGASGYVPADGVGALIVRPLADAEADGDRILAVVRGSAVNHTGRTPGYTVTSPDAQSRVVEDALARAGVVASTVTLLEAHGAATALGDRLEVDALTRAFRKETDARGFCAIGSVKANIGHTEAAAGLASITKILLCLRHRTLVPAPHAEHPNADIDFAASPFRLPAAEEPWTPLTDPETGRSLPLRAAVSGFGFGGSGAHVVLEEYVPAPVGPAPDPAAHRVVGLSARTGGQLTRRASDLAAALRAEPGTRLADVAHTLAVGRRHLGERLGIVVASTAELIDALEDFVAGRTPAVAHFRATARRAGAGSSPAAPPSGPSDTIARAWADGTVNVLAPVPGGRRIALPAYPFAGDRHWVTPPEAAPVAPQAGRAAPADPGGTAGTPPAARPEAVDAVPGRGTVPLADLEQVMLYEPAWAPRAAPAETVGLDGGPVLVLDTGEERFRAIRARTGAVLVTPGTGFARISAEHFTVAPDSPTDHEQVRKALQAERRVPSAVLHLWHLDGSDPAGRPEQPTGLLSVYALCQAWAMGRRTALPVVHAYHAPQECPPDASVGGLARGLRLEQPKLPLSSVRFAAVQSDPARAADVLLAEAGRPGDLEVRYTATGLREVRGFAPTTPLPSGTPLARAGGTYLISGGTGGIARHVARRMALAARPDLVLFGRSPEGPEQREFLAELAELGSRARYVQADVTRLADVRRLVASAEERFGTVTGVIHTAGVVEDGLLINKKPDSIRRVLAPKFAGARNLDLATADRPLDYLVLFSSTSAVLGSIGTTDYTAANAYLDAFAAWREGLVERGERRGRCVSVNWPLWDDGGMRINPAVEAQVLHSTGLVPLRTAHGLAALEAGLAHDGPQVAVFEGDRAKIERLLAVIRPERRRAPVAAAGPVPDGSADSPGTAGADATAELEAMIGESVTGLLPRTAALSEELFTWTFMELGLTSVDVVALGELLGRQLGIEVPPTVFFRCTRVPDLAAHLARENSAAVSAWFASFRGTPTAPTDTETARADAPTARAGTETEPGTETAPGPRAASGEAAAPDAGATPGRQPVGAVASADRDIAVIGLAGRFPGAADARELWEALVSGRDLVSDVPGDRWDHSRFLDADGPAGTTECPAGGFLDDVSRFDAAFFGIPRAEAEAMDPQLRLLMEVLYETAEDAAVLPRLRGSDTGVFVGECFRDYEGEMIARDRKPGPYDATGIATTMAANRPSHYFDLSGPSLTVDTACSSSLYALQLAVESLRRGECSMAFAAGANLMLTPRHYLSLSGTGALSPSGRCHAFDESADGYVPAEAVAAVLLKPLRAALADGDPVRAVIKGAAVGHGGHAGAVTAPRPDRQSELIERAWRDAGVPVHTMGLLEAHGTGTRLGDPIEVDGLRGALAGGPTGLPPVALGTAKAHLGHAEGAAGVVGVVKAVLSLETGVVPAMPGFTRENPYLGLDSGFLAVPSATSAWRPRAGSVRRAGVSSFGFGGAGAHIVLEEAPRPAHQERAGDSSLVVPFSAPSADRLPEVLRRHRAVLTGELSLTAVAATLQHGREDHSARVAVVARTADELRSELDALLGGRVEAGTVRAAARSDARALAAARRWAADGDLDRTPLRDVPRLNLPGLPFGGETFWLRETAPAPVTAAPAPQPAPAQAPVRASAPAGDAGGPVAGALAAARSFMDASTYDATGVRRGLERLGTVGARLAALAVREHLGVTRELSGADVLSGLPAVEPYGRFVTRLADVVTGAPRPLPDAAAERRLIEAEFAGIAADHPEVADHVALARAVVPSIPDVVTGRSSALDLYFGGEIDELLSRIYTGNAIADHYNAVVARLADGYVRDRLAERPGEPVRILEVGAGTGGTTGPVLRRLAPYGEQVEYTFTDVSASYFRQARRTFAASGVPLVFTRFDLERDPADQGIEAGSYDLLIASNVVHATEDITSSAAHLRRLLSDGGVLLLNEITSNIDYQFLLFAMIPSWWTCKDDERLPGAPLLAPSRWQEVLGRAGFTSSWVQTHDNGVAGENDQCVIVAGADRAAGLPGTATATAPAVTVPASGERAPTPPAAVPDTPASTEAAVRAHLREVVASFLSVPAAGVGDDVSFSDLGVDSLGTIQLVRELEDDFGKLPKVLLYEAGTVAALAQDLVTRAPLACAGLVGAPVTESGPHPAAAAAPPAEEDDPVAIVGMAVRLPGARTSEELWHNLRAGTDHMTQVPAERWDWRPLFGDPHREEGKTNSKWGAFVDGVTEFDAGFFGISGREAEVMDPQQRLMLQTAWHAVEDSGHAPSSLHGSDTGVFIGATSHDYTAHLADVGRYREPYAVNGNAKTVLANRISFELGLHGPSEAVDTACASSLTALHRAVRAIRDGECATAIVGGVHLLLHPDMYVALGQMGALSPDGRCHTFDREANGFSRGEGVVAVYVKPLSRALADGDTVHALVRGSGVNHGGRAQSLPVPNPAAQASLISQVLRGSGTDPRTIGYVEAHGTGTEVGDPIELRGLRKAFAEVSGVPEEEPVDAWCAVGSIKSNMGHLEAAAGLAGVAKAVLALRHGAIPPSVNFREANPLLDLDGSPFEIADRLRAWAAPVGEGGERLPRRAAVSAMGFGGSNAHVVLEEYPPHAPDAPAESATDRERERVYVLSARCPERLKDAARALADRVEGDPALTAGAVARTLHDGRDAMEWRLAVVARNLRGLVAALRGHVRGDTVDGLFTGRASHTGTAAAPTRDPRALARHWTTGRAGSAELDALAPPTGARRVSLPGYPFAPDRYWAEADTGTTDGPAAPATGDDEAAQQLVAQLEALSRGELTVDDVDLRLVRNDGMER
ncbi:SDR family NAD(P)-dependent oxidoreductase [Streptomyces sp. NPDC006995]|uniref:SDR family NAD(P)-dependent oxidoreductase n=1 Tax=Streptomyces sp. NPDC006995 TaxID=3156907 RepID=UPI0033D6E01D